MKAFVAFAAALLITGLLAWYLFFQSHDPKIEKISITVSASDSTIWAAPAMGKGGALAWTSVTEPGVFVELPGGEKWKAWEGRLGERLLAWSPDGRYVAFRAELNPEQIPRSFALIVAEPGARKIVFQSEYQPGLGRPQWRHVGRTMEVYSATRDGLLRREYDSELHGAETAPWVYEKDGEVWIEGIEELPKQISRGGGYAPALSPDGGRLLYQWGDGIFIANVSDPPAEERTMMTRGSAAAWSPDGRSIALVKSVDKGHDGTQEADIFILDLSTPTPRETRLTETPAEIEMELDWPEKNRIIYSVRNDGTIRSAEIQ